MNSRPEIIERPEWRHIFETLPILQRFFAGDPHGHGMRELLHAIAINLEKTLYHVDAGHPFVWHNLGFNPELIYAMGDVAPFSIETLGVLHCLLGDIDTTLEFIDTAHAAGVPNDSCSADKLAVGAMHKALYPQPCCTIGINTPCDAQVASTQMMAEISQAPFFVIDVPYYHNDETIQHVASQLEELIPFLEEQCGRNLNYDRLREVCDLSNQMTEAIWEWLEWRKLKPLSQSSKLVAFTLVMQILFAGTREGVRLARELGREARERTERGEAFFEERVRAVWYQDPVWTDMQIYDWFERELGLTVPIDIFGYYAHEGLIDTSTPESMLYGLARKLTNCHPMSRQFRSDIDIYINDFMHLIEGWNADCCIFAGHIACKHAWAGIGLFKEACRRADIPVLFFEFDMFDPRITPHEDIFFEVERFVNEIVVPHKLRS